MKTRESFQKDLFSVNNDNFNDFALKLFHFQSKNNEIYRTYLHHLNIDPLQIKNVENIPFLPIEFFKHFAVQTNNWNPEHIFESSGTTGMIPSRHYVRELDWYNRVSEWIFSSFYGQLNNYHILALLPSYLERKNASLVFMLEDFIKRSGSRLSGFYLNDFDKLHSSLEELKSRGNRTILFGVTFALLDFCEKFPMEFENLMIIETGGMKGRKKEMTRAEVHEELKKGFSVENVHSEYGMTELLSQAYSKGNGIFQPPWCMRTLTRELHDPFCIKKDNKTGGINVIDLSNIDSCAFIETKDLGMVYDDSSFEVLGRFDNSELRGCNLLSI